MQVVNVIVVNKNTVKSIKSFVFEYDSVTSDQLLQIENEFLSLIRDQGLSESDKEDALTDCYYHRDDGDTVGIAYSELYKDVVVDFTKSHNTQVETPFTEAVIHGVPRFWSPKKI